MVGLLAGGIRNSRLFRLQNVADAPRPLPGYFPHVLILVLFALVLTLVGLFGAARFGWIVSAGAVVFTLAVVGFTTWFVFSNDAYVQNGSSKWDTRGSEAHDLYIAAVAIAGVLVALYGFLAIRRVRGPVVSAAIIAGGLLEAFGLVVVALAFGAN